MTDTTLHFFCFRLLENTEIGGEAGSKLGRVATEIRALEYLSRRSAEAGGRRQRGKEGVRLRTGRGGQVEVTEVPKSRQAFFFCLFFAVFLDS